jgi:hypothetical protein
MLSNLSGLEAVLIGLAVAVFVIVRQFRARRVMSAATMLPPLALTYFGLANLGQLDTTGLVLLVVNTSLAVALGVARGTTFRIWSGARGEALMQGTRLTLLLWVATIGVRVAVSFVEQRAGLGTYASAGAELLIPVAATLATQNIVAYLRSRDQQLVAAA